MPQLTDATNYEVESQIVESEMPSLGDNDYTDELEINRWSKKGDRLYINGPAKWEKNGTYLDLETAELVDTPGPRDVEITVEDEQVTVHVVDEGGPGVDKERTIVLSFEAAEEDESEDNEDGDGETDADEGDDHEELRAFYHKIEEEFADDDEDEQEIVADGGEDVTSHADDETIEAAIEQNDDPDHPDAHSVEEVRDILAYIQRGAEECWDTYMHDIEEGNMTVVYEDHDVIVLETGQINVVSEEVGRYSGDVEIGQPTSAIVTSIHHELARERCDYDWGVSYPLVIRKPEGFDAGQRYVEAVVNGLQTRGCSPGQAWAYYGVKIRGNSRNNWGLRKGDHDHKNVSDALDKAEKKLP